MIAKIMPINKTLAVSRYDMDHPMGQNGQAFYQNSKEKPKNFESVLKKAMESKKTISPAYEVDVTRFPF